MKGIGHQDQGMQQNKIMAKKDLSTICLCFYMWAPTCVKLNPSLDYLQDQVHQNALLKVEI